MNFHASASNSKQQSQAMQSLKTWQDFHPVVLTDIDNKMSQTVPEVQTNYNDFKRINKAALDAHTMLILPRLERQGRKLNWT